MYEDSLTSLKPEYQEACKELRDGRSSEVYRHKDLQLAQTADIGPWEPSEEVQSYVPNIKSVQVEMLTEGTNIEMMFEIFRREKDVGLVLMGHEISREDKPSLIVMVTNKIYFVIDPRDDTRGLQVLKAALQSPDLTLWTTSGLFEADCLWHNYGIKLLGSNAKCCLGLHLHLMKVISCLPLHVLDARNESASFYPERALNLAKQKDPSLADYKLLLKTWLQLDETGHFDFNPNQMVHLETRPLNGTAKNMIIRRCCLVLKLAAALEFFLVSEFSIMNRNSLEWLSHCNETTAKLIRSVMDKDEKRKVASTLYYSHLDNGNSNMEGSLHRML